MFESGMFASGNTIHTKTRTTLVLSVLLQGALLTLMVMIPLLHPEILHLQTVNTISVPVFTPPPRIVATTAAASGPSMASERTINIASNSTPRLPSPFGSASDNAPMEPTFSGNMGSGGLSNLPVCSDCLATVTGPGKAGPMRVSSGVMEGRLMVAITPVYPAIALTTRTQGTVVIQAIISENGRILNAHAVSGPPMLYGAALDAVRQARYAPFKLNGQAVQVETTINIVFHLS